MRPLIVDCADDADVVLSMLFDTLSVVALDTETTDCNPKKESPVGRARLWCMTLAWGDESAFVPREWLPAFKSWLESAGHFKVGQNIFGYDRHVLANEGITLRGIVGDTQRMSKLLNPANDGGHGLKDQARRLGIDMRDYSDVVKTVWHGKTRPTKLGVRKDQPGRVAKAVWAHTPVDFTKTSEESIQVLAECPERYARIQEYACLDAVATLAVYRDLTTKLMGVQW